MYDRLLIKLLFFGLLSSQCVAQQLRDPTAPPYYHNYSDNDEQAGQEQSLKLTSIWISKQSRRATVNGQTVKVGDVIPDQIKILQINKGSITIDKNGIHEQLWLFGNDIEKR